MERFNRISHDVNIMGGKACITGTRITVGAILTLISEGISNEELLVQYPYLTEDDIIEALQYAAWAVGVREDAVAFA
ncbi:MAG: DUF433 domain-containing protein [Oscillospiraceae bacterium]|nr:DUF433 domain-containing protein [Oscillospiraceae bacterium]